MKKYTCSKCAEDKLKDEFHKNKATKTGLHTICKECRSIHYKKSYFKGREKNLLKQQRIRDNRTIKQKEQIKKSNVRWSRDNLVNRLLVRAKDRARKRGLEFNLNKEDILIPKLCPLLEVPFK